MNRRITLFFASVAILTAVMAGEMFYFGTYATDSKLTMARKRSFVSITGLPDLAVATEARFIRFRTLADIYSPFNEGPELLDYFPATFTYAPSETEYLIPSRISTR